MSKPTPGPWVAQPDPHGLLDDWMVGTIGGKPDDIAVCEEHNARLIAAAPELLEALCSLIDAMNWRDAHAAASCDPHKYQYACENVFRHMDAARAAIAKAKGEA